MLVFPDRDGLEGIIGVLSDIQNLCSLQTVSILPDVFELEGRLTCVDLINLGIQLFSPVNRLGRISRVNSVKNSCFKGKRKWFS